MPLSLFEGALGGVGLFLLGMRIMSDGIRTVADDRVRSVFSAATSNRLYSMLFGALLSLVLNSATAAVIFSLGLVNGGVLNVFQALNVLGGVVVGASLSLYLPGVSYGFVATPLVFVGVLLKFFARRRRFANGGDLLLGVGLLFLGLSLLEGSFSPTDSHPFYGMFNGAFFQHPLPALIFGAVISWFIQSSTALITVISSLAASRHMDVEIAGAMALGGGVGVAAIGCLASIAGINVSRRITLGFLLINLAVVLPLMLVVPSLSGALQGSVIPVPPDRSNPLFTSLAQVHSVATLFTACVATLLSGVLSRVAGPHGDHGGAYSAPQPCAGYLDSRILNTPTLAMEQARKEIGRMVAVTSFMFADTRELLFDYDARRAETIRKHEQTLDSLNHEITVFLAKLARSSTNPAVSLQIPGLLQTVTDLEQIGDCCEGILDCVITRKEEHIIFSDDAMEDLRRLAAVVASVVAELENRSAPGPAGDAGRTHETLSSVRSTFDEIKRSHIERICAGICSPRTALMFSELNEAFVRIAELSWSIMTVQEHKNV
jgi:phosphate:Na+ symporter